MRCRPISFAPLLRNWLILKLSQAHDFLSAAGLIILNLMSSRFSSTKGPSQRQLRAGELIRHALVEIMQRESLRDPALDGVSVTVSEVRVSPDLSRQPFTPRRLAARLEGKW